MVATAAGWIGKRPELYARLHEFNFLPTKSLDASWHDAYFPASMAPFLARGNALDARTHRWLSGHLIERAGLDPAGHWAPGGGLALALLEAASLTSLAARIGAVLLCARAHDVARDAAEGLRARLGPELYAFAAPRAPLLVSADENLAGLATGTSTPEALGLAALRAVFEPEGLWPRVRLKLARDRAEPSAAASPAKPEARRIALRIARESEPRWHTSFAPASA